MQISFYDNICKIDQDTTLPLGRLTCDILNDTTDWDSMRSVQAIVAFIEPMDDISVSDYRNELEMCRARVETFQESVRNHCFYRYTDEAEITFSSVLTYINDLLADIKLKAANDEQKVAGLGLDFHSQAFENAMENIDAFYDVHQAAVRVFSKTINDCMLYIGSTREFSPIERVAGYGFDKLQAQTRELVQNAHTASSAVYAPDYEIVVREDGEKTLAHVVNINHIAQFMYHEILNIIMQGHYFRKCKHCGRYFMQYGDRVVEYCDQIPEGATKPCNVIGPTRQFTASLHEDPIKMTYSRVYKKYIAQRRTGMITDAHFKAWAVQAKQRREEAYKNEETNAVAFQRALDELMRQIVECGE